MYEKKNKKKIIYINFKGGYENKEWNDELNVIRDLKFEINLNNSNSNENINISSILNEIEKIKTENEKMKNELSKMHSWLAMNEIEYNLSSQMKSSMTKQKHGQIKINIQ